MGEMNPYDMDLMSTLENLTNVYSPFRYVNGTHMLTAFGHLDGYGPLYYTYQWSLGIADDMFYSEFCPNKMQNSEVANTFRETVLAPGGKNDASQLVKDFVGRVWDVSQYTR